MSYIGTEPAYGVFQRQVLTGDGSTTQFNLDYPAPQATSLLVSLDGIIQEPEYSYDVAISNGQPVINFSEAPDASGRVFIVYMGRQLLTSTPANTETHIDEFNGDGSTTAFTLTKTPSANTADNFLVFVDNVYQRLGASYAYTVSGEALTFTAPPPSGTNNIQVIQLCGSNTILTVEDGTITNAKLSLSYSSTSATGDGSTTAFTITAGHTVESVLVFENGVCLEPTTDYTISGTTLTFTTAPLNGANVRIRYLPV